MPDDPEDKAEGENQTDEGLDASDLKQIWEKCKSGDLEKDQEDIDETIIAFEPSLFKTLENDTTGDKVVCVLIGQVIATDDNEVVVEFSKASVVHGKMKSMEPGGGGRFQHLEHVLEGRGDVKNPGGLSAWIGRKKYGSAKMAGWSAKGRGK